MKGYLDAPELTGETLVDGWLRTGDLGSLDAAGHLRIVGRRKNMIVTEGGKNVYAEDVEAAFGQIECEELCVFASSYLWPEQASGPEPAPAQSARVRAVAAERLTLVVRPRAQDPVGKLTSQIAEANLKLADFKRVSSYLVWGEEFPRTASMKVKREELARQVRQAAVAAELLRTG
jgi:long-chain acyl-CoA synthetase